MATIPATKTWSVGNKLDANALNLELRDALDFLLDGYPRVHAYDNTGVACADNTDVLLALSGEVYDNDNMHSTSSNTSRITFTTAGLYEVQINVQWPNATYTVSDIMVRLNADGAVGGGTGLRTMNYQTARVAQMRFRRLFAAGDRIEFWLRQASGGSKTTVTGPLATYVQAHWVAVS